MFGNDDPRYRGVNPLSQNPNLDGAEPRYAGPADGSPGKGGVFAIVAIIAVIAAGLFFFASEPDEAVRQAGEPQAPATTQQPGAAGS